MRRFVANFLENVSVKDYFESRSLSDVVLINTWWWRTFLSHGVLQLRKA